VRLAREAKEVVKAVKRPRLLLWVTRKSENALMPRLLNQPPKYRLHKPTGQAVVSIFRRQVYLGKHGSPESHQRYEQEIANWRRSLARMSTDRNNGAAGDSPVAPAIDVKTLRERREAGQPISLNELILVYLKHARQYYRKNGQETREAGQITEVLRFLRKHHGRVRAEKLGPVLFKELREGMVRELDWSRKHTNKQASRLVRMFKWAVENELASPDSHAALAAVAGLKKGRTDARETDAVACVDDAVVDATIKHLPELISDMVRLQRLTGARPGEICSLKPKDIDRSSNIWVYIPAVHKNEHHNQERVVMIGPKAQEILRPYLLRPADAFCFTPKESEQRRFEKLAAERTTPLRKRDREAGKKRRLRKYADSYTADTYRHAVQRTCKIRGLAKWSPNQLRHTAATEIRRRYGLEAAQVVCGHQSADITQVYAERNFALARKVAAEVG